MPSLASSLWKSCCCSSRSIASALSNGTSAPDCTDRLMSPTALEALCGGQNCLAYSTTCSQNASAGKISLTRPSSFARSNEKVSPFTISSIASDFPTIRARRCVPPVPGRTPRLTSGSPILPAFSFARRRSHAMAISSPPPTVWPLSAAIVSFGVCSRRLSVSLAWRQKKYLKRGVTLLSIAMFAPAEKNFSPWPRSTMTCTLSSKSALTCCSVMVAMELFRLLMGLDEAAEEDARHEIGQPRGIDVAGGVVPVVDPVHHAKEDVGRRATIVGALLGRGLFENGLEEVHIAPLDGAHAARWRFMRQHLHLGHVLGEERNVMPDERLQALLRIACGRDRLSRAFQDLCETTLLNQGEQVFFAADVVVHPRQGHPARGGEVPHGGGVVALVRKDPGGAGEQVVETLVVWSHEFERSFEIGSYARLFGAARCLVSGVWCQTSKTQAPDTRHQAPP